MSVESPHSVTLHPLTIAAQTGKSSLAVQFVDGHFVESYYPTIENTFSKVIKYKGQDFSTEIIDTAGQVSCAPPLSWPLTVACLGRGAIRCFFEG